MHQEPQAPELCPDCKRPLAHLIGEEYSSSGKCFKLLYPHNHYTYEACLKAQVALLQQALLAETQRRVEAERRAAELLLLAVQPV